VGLVQDEDGGASTLLSLGQQSLGRLDGETGAEVGGGLTEGAHDLFVDASDPDQRVTGSSLNSAAVWADDGSSWS
jgi:hypothetical protein